MHYFDETIAADDDVHICPVCGKLFRQPKAMYLHIMRAHPSGQQMAFDLQADLYRRWQQRILRLDQ
ncbi:MAG: hypothetical protein ACUVSX_09700 [Aggregatilineales bacterium]